MTRKISLVGSSIGGAAAAVVADDVERPDMSGTKAKSGLIANTHADLKLGMILKSSQRTRPCLSKARGVDTSSTAQERATDG